MLFIPLLFFVFLTVGVVIIGKRSFGKCLPVTLLAAVFILYITQMIFGSFKIGYIALVIGSAAGGGAGLWWIIIKKNSMIREKVFSYGLYAFIAVFLIYFIIDYRRSFSTWDELSHWGVMVIEMLRLDQFYSVPESRLLVHKDYPPFVSVFEMLWCKLCGGYSESAVTMSLHIFTLSLIVPPIADFQYEKKGFKHFLSAVSLSVIIILLIGTFDVYGIFETIYNDMFMPILYVYAISLLIDRGAFYDLFDYIGLVLSLSALIISKQMGIAFVMLVYLYYVLHQFVDWRKRWPNSHGNDSRGQEKIYVLTKMGILFLMPVLSYISWTRYVDSLNITGQQFSFSKIKLSEIVNILFRGGGSQVQRSVYKSYVLALCERNLFSGIISIAYVSSIFIALIFLFILWRAFKKKFEKENVLMLSIVFICGTAGYAFTMFVLYMFCYSEGEALKLASFERYMSSYVVSEFLILLILLVRLAYSCKKQYVNYKSLAVALAFGVLMLDHESFEYLLPQRILGNNMTKWRQYAEIIENGTETDASVFLICEENCRNQYYVNYFLDTQRVYFNYKYNDLITYDFSTKEMENDAINEIAKNDYIFVITTNDDINKVFEKYTGGEALQTNAVYRVLSSENGISLARQ